jgi:ESCRT-I complex subunit VPS37
LSATYNTRETVFVSFVRERFVIPLIAFSFSAINLSREQELQELREEVDDKVQTVEALKARYDRLIQRYNKLSEVFAPEHIRDSLKTAADESQEQSEKIAQDFLNRKIDVERFLSTYVECRKLGQARRTKEEKLAHQLNELKRANY